MLQRRRIARRLACAALLLALTMGCGNGQEAVAVVLVPGPEATTIAQAIVLLANGGIIQLGAGTFQENLVVTGDRHIELAGAGKGTTKILAADGGLPVLHVHGRAALSLRDLALEGGSAGVQGEDDLTDCGAMSAETRPGPVLLTRVEVQGSFRGIAGTFSTLDLTDVDISNCTFHGVSVSASRMAAARGRYEMNLGAGIFVNNNCPDDEGDICIRDVHLELNDLGGVLVTGGARPVKIERVTAERNTVAGIWLIGVTAFTVNDCTMHQNRAVGDSGPFGDGLIAASSTGTVTNSRATMNDRVGISSFDNALVTVAGCFIAGGIHLNFEGGGSFVDDGGNCCDTQSPCGVCSAQTSELSPAPPMP